MKNEIIYNEISLLDDDLIVEAINHTRNNKPFFKRRLYKFISIAACFIFMVVVGNLIFKAIFYTDFDLVKSDNIKIKYIVNAPVNKKEYSIINLTEEQIFNEYASDVYRGRIEEIKNIEINFNGEIVYRAIAKIKIITNYKGSHQSGDIISVLLPYSVNNDAWVEDADYLSSMKLGTRGIFILYKYTENTRMVMNNATIYWNELSEFGLISGNRCVFVETDDGIIFDTLTYRSISSDPSIEEIEELIKSKIK